MASRLDGRIDTLEQKLRALRVQQQRTTARRRAMEARRTRRDETRRRILVGAIVLAKVARGEIAEATLTEWLQGALRRAEDRELFGLGEP